MTSHYILRAGSNGAYAEPSNPGELPQPRFESGKGVSAVAALEAAWPVFEGLLQGDLHSGSPKCYMMLCAQGLT